VGEFKGVPDAVHHLVIVIIVHDDLGHGALGARVIDGWCPTEESGPGMNVELVGNGRLVGTVATAVDSPGLRANPAVGGNVPVKVTEEAISDVGTAVEFRADLGVHIVPRAAKAAFQETIKRIRSMASTVTTRPFEVVFADSMTHRLGAPLAPSAYLCLTS
jgi:hypothetical protein